MDTELLLLSERIASVCGHERPGRPLVIATAESCTGGWAAQVITHTAGSSAWFDCGFVTYSNAAKRAMLGVCGPTLEAHGAVSRETAGEMVAGALRQSNAVIALAITGIAGPSGGSAGKPVGTVCFAWCVKDAAGGIQAPSCERRLFAGDREAVRRQAVIHALSGLVACAKSVP